MWLNWDTWFTAHHVTPFIIGWESYKANDLPCSANCFTRRDNRPIIPRFALGQALSEAKDQRSKASPRHSTEILRFAQGDKKKHVCRRKRQGGEL